MSQIILSGLPQGLVCLQGNEIQDFVFSAQEHLRVASFSDPIASCNATTTSPRNYLEVLDEKPEFESVGFSLSSIPIFDRCGTKQLDVATGIGAEQTLGILLNFGFTCGSEIRGVYPSGPTPTPESGSIILVLLGLTILLGVKKCFTHSFTSSSL